MKNNFTLKRCPSCGALVEVLQDCNCENCGIKCCGQEMVVVKENSIDCAVEKHMPSYEIVGNYIYVSVNHVMENDHYIEWIALDADGLTGKKYLKPMQRAVAVFPYVKGSKLFAYCNKHGLWAVEVK